MINRPGEFQYVENKKGQYPNISYVSFSLTVRLGNINGFFVKFHVQSFYVR